MEVAMRRMAATVAGFALLYVAYSQTQTPSPTYHSASRPGQLELSFWVNHHGLEQFDVRGEVGFGDMARILLRRRSNAEWIRPLRDRFLFQTTDFKQLRAPDVFRVKCSEGRADWIAKPERFIAATGQTINIPLIVENGEGTTTQIRAEISGIPDSGFSAALGPGTTSGYFLKQIEHVPGSRPRKLSVTCGDSSIAADVHLDVRPLAKLHVRLIDESGGDTSARVYLTGSDGLAYVPNGLISRIAAMPAE